MQKRIRGMAALAAITLSATAWADSLLIPMHIVDEKGVQKQIGEVAVNPSDYGLVFTPALQGLEPGLHGFHIHEAPSCEPSEQDGKMVPAGAAKGHWDPENTGQHGEPWGKGHLGDLPPLYVAENGEATQPVLAPRLKNIDDLRGHSLMVHEGGDNHSDHPKPLGGGGARVACGVIQ